MINLFRDLSTKLRFARDDKKKSKIIFEFVSVHLSLALCDWTKGPML